MFLEFIENIKSRYLIRIVLPVLISTSFLAVISFVGNILVQNWLNSDEVGIYTIVISLISIIGPVSQAGQTGQMLRKYSGSPSGHYNWPRDLTGNFLNKFDNFILYLVLVPCPDLFHRNSIIPHWLCWLFNSPCGYWGRSSSSPNQHQVLSS